MNVPHQENMQTELIASNFSPPLKIPINDQGWGVRADKSEFESWLYHLQVLRS